MSDHIGTLDSAEGSFEDNGFLLTLHTDEGSGTVRIPNVQTAEALLEAVRPLKDWSNEYRAAESEWRVIAALEAEEAEEDAYAPDDPKHPTYHDRYAAFYDDRDKGVVGP